MTGSNRTRSARRLRAAAKLVEMIRSLGEVKGTRGASVDPSSDQEDLAQRVLQKAVSGSLAGSGNPALSSFLQALPDLFDDALGLTFDAAVAAVAKRIEESWPIVDSLRYLRGVAKFTAREMHRQGKRHVVRREPLFDEDHTVSHGESDADAKLDCRAAIDRLTQDQRAVIRLYFFDGLTFDEIGARRGYSKASAHRRYRAALRNLEDRLPGYGSE